MFKSTEKLLGSPGFHLTFANGWTVSVQWNRDGIYCDGETNAEIGWWHETKTHTVQVEGWQNADQVAAKISEIANWS